MNPALFGLPWVCAVDVVPVDGNLGSLLDLAACGVWARHIANGRTVTAAQHNAVVASLAFATDVLASARPIASAGDLFDVDTVTAGSAKPSVLLGRRGLSFDRGDAQWPNAQTDEGVIDLTTITEGERREAWVTARACLRLLASESVAFVKAPTGLNHPTKPPAGWTPYIGPSTVLVGPLATGGYINLPRGGLTLAQCEALATVRVRYECEDVSLAVAVHHGRIADTAAWLANARTTQRCEARSARMTAENPLQGERAARVAAVLASAVRENGDGGTTVSAKEVLGLVIDYTRNRIAEGLFERVTHF